MYADPQSVTINAVAVSLPRTGMGQSSGAFTSADGNVALSVTHNVGKRVRRTVRLSHRKVAADPFVSGLSSEYSASVYLTVDHPKTGYSATEVKQIIDALTAYLTASTGARVTQLLGGEA